MAAQKKQKYINLLPQEEFAASTLGRVLGWLLSTFRIIVVTTEMVVMVAFLSRFYLDARSTDLNDQIKKDEALITSYSSFENNFRLAQQKLKIFDGLTDEEGKFLPLLQVVSSHLPEDTKFISFSLTSQDLQIKASSLTEQSIAQFITNLESTNLFEKISLGQITSQADNPTIVFMLKIKTNK